MGSRNDFTSILNNLQSKLEEGCMVCIPSDLPAWTQG